MKKFSIFSPRQSWKKEGLPLSPFLYLAVSTYFESDGKLLLTPQLMVASEIDHEVDCLIMELEELRKAAKKELRALQSNMLYQIVISAKRSRSQKCIDSKG